MSRMVNLTEEIKHASSLFTEISEAFEYPQAEFIRMAEILTSVANVLEHTPTLCDRLSEYVNNDLTIRGIKVL